MKFNKIVAVDNLGLIQKAYDKLRDYGNEIIFYSAQIKEDKKLIEIISDAECLLVSWDTVINKNVIDNCRNLKYIGMCCSLFEGKSSNVDVNAARKKGILVYGVNGYGDNVAEFAISELIQLIHGYGDKQWKQREQEISGQKIGIIGIGATGKLLADAIKFFGADVYYYSRSKKEGLDAKYLELDELLETVDIVSTHLPQNTFILNKEKLDRFGNNKIVINTSIGPTYVFDDMKEWLKNDSNYLITDRVGAGSYIEELKSMKNVIYTDKVAAKTFQMDIRLSNSVIENIERASKEIFK